MKCSKGQKCQTACKPGSVPPPLTMYRAAVMAIPLGRSLPSASCDRPERRREGSPGARISPGRLPLLLGLAPGGVFPAAAVAGSAVRSYRTISPLPPRRRTGEGPAVYFLWHFPWGRPRRGLPGTVPPWSPDFPLPAQPRRAAIRPSGMGRFGQPWASVKAPAEASIIGASTSAMREGSPCR
jgi:hypothetical protein